MGVDVTIMGAGIFGLTCAWACLIRGAKVRVIDPNGPGAGASGGLLGAMAPHTPDEWNTKKDFQFHSLIAAETFWSEVAEISGQDPGYARCGRLQSIPDDRVLALAYQREKTSRDLWQGHAYWQVVQATGDWAPFSPTGFLIHDTLTARLHPRQAIDALANALRARGVEIVTHSPHQGAILWATGIDGLVDLSKDLDRPVGTALKGQAALVRFAQPGAPQLFADGVHIVPHGDGTTAIGSTSERIFENANTTDQAIHDLIAQARSLVPVLQSAEVVKTWAGLRPRAKSRAPILGGWPGRPGHFVANGGFKIGFGMAPRIGEVMARLLIDGDNLIPEEFRLTIS